jgi:hypothetical protein
MKKFSQLSAVAIVLVGLGALCAYIGSVPARADGGLSANPYTTPPALTNINGAVSVMNVSTCVFSNDSWGVGALLCNDSPSNMYAAVGAPAVAHSGILLAPGVCVPLPYPTTAPINVIALNTDSNKNTLTFSWGKLHN